MATPSLTPWNVGVPQFLFLSLFSPDTLALPDLIHFLAFSAPFGSKLLPPAPQHLIVNSSPVSFPQSLPSVFLWTSTFCFHLKVSLLWIENPG